MLSTITINGLTIGTGTSYPIVSAKGFGSADVRTSQYNIPSRHRAEVPRAFYGARKMLLEVGMIGGTQSAYETLRDDLLEAFDLPVRGKTTMQITTTTGRAVQLEVQLRMPVEADHEPGRLTTGVAMIDLIAPDPIFYSQTEYSETITTSTTPETLTNGGNARVYPKRLLFYGAITDPYADNYDMGEVLAYIGTISNTTYIEIDPFEETALLMPGGNNVVATVDGDFIQLKTGGNVVNWSGDSPSGNEKLVVHWRYGWLGL